MEREESIPLPTRIAAFVHAHFDALPARYKPRTRDDGSREWIPMSGFVVVQGMLGSVLKILQISICLLTEKKGRILRQKH